MSSTIHQVPPSVRDDRIDVWARATIGDLVIGAGRCVLVAGTGPGLPILAAHLAPTTTDGIRMIVLGSEDAPIPPDWLYAGPLSRFGQVVESAPVDEVVLCLTGADRAFHVEILERCAARGIPVSIPLPATDAQGANTRPLQAVLKRAIDVLGAATGLVILSPLVAASAAAIAMDDGMPVLFRQRRAGRFGRPFTIFKFRTMERGADARRDELRSANQVAGDAAFKIDHDPRVTRLGRWIRRLSIDELPQLWNVLKGEMSLVGPRPHPYDDVAGYAAWHLRRLAVKPGITGLWQLDLRNDEDFDRWVAKDLEYIDRWSVGLDIKIIARTIPAVLRGGGR